MIEAMLQVTGAEPEAEARQERAAAIFQILEDGLTEAFASAPDILFVAGAGNEDENVEFVTSVPAGINLPNVITIGAVDRELQPAGFTSYGESIDLYANGFEVPGRVPGGRILNLSGTLYGSPASGEPRGEALGDEPRSHRFRSGRRHDAHRRHLKANRACRSFTLRML